MDVFKPFFFIYYKIVEIVCLFMSVLSGSIVISCNLSIKKTRGKQILVLEISFAFRFINFSPVWCLLKLVWESEVKDLWEGVNYSRGTFFIHQITAERTCEMSRFMKHTICWPDTQRLRILCFIKSNSNEKFCAHLQAVHN